MSPGRKRGVLIGGIAVMVVVVVAAVVVLLGGGNSGSSASAGGTTTSAGPSAPDPVSAAREYLQAFAAGDTDTAGKLTDDPSGSSTLLSNAWQALRPVEIQATLGNVGPISGNTASAAYTMTWALSGGHNWSYNGTFGLVGNHGNWRVHWTPAVLQPTLQAGQRLVVVSGATDQPAVIDRSGTPLVTTGPGGTRVTGTDDFPLLRTALLGQVSTTTLSDVFAVERVDSAGNNLATLYGSTGGQVTTRKSTLSVAVQTAAQAAVDAYRGKAVIVAIQPSDGGLLAVAENSLAAGSSPFSGLYPPGSTFKIVTATAALEAGIATPNSSLPCPLTAQVGTRTISNEGFDLGVTTMHHAFARSCNTTFAHLGFQLARDGLPNAASQYGLNADFDIPGLSTQSGKVVSAADSDEQVEDSIGQGTVQVSPFGEALMAATVAAGHAVTPRLWLDADTTVTTPYSAPPAGVLAQLRPMMREVVTDGTATGLANSGVVYGKTGTAQFGSGAQAHGWFVGYRGDLAFVVFLEGANDSKPAVTVAAQFLAGLK